MTVTRDDYEVKTRLGAPIRSFDDFKRAKKWTAENKGVFPGCTIEHVRVQVIEERRTVYRPRLRLVGSDDLTIPATPQRRAS